MTGELYEKKAVEFGNVSAEHVLERLPIAYNVLGGTSFPQDADKFLSLAHADQDLTRFSQCDSPSTAHTAQNVSVYRILRNVVNLYDLAERLGVPVDDTLGLLEDMLSVCILHDVRPSTQFPSMLSYYPSATHMERGAVKRVRGKPAKIIRKLFPLTDTETEQFFKSYMTLFSPEEYTLRVGSDAASFRAGYACNNDHARDTDMEHNRRFASGNYLKYLSSSCMRYWGSSPNSYGMSWLADNTHPAETFATECEYMSIVTVWNSENKLAARACFSRKDKVASVIYSTCIKAGMMIDDYLVGEGLVHSLHSDRWPNFKTRAVRHKAFVDRNGHVYSGEENQPYHMCYLDMHLRNFDLVDGHFVVGSEHRGGECQGGLLWTKHPEHNGGHGYYDDDDDDIFTCDGCNESIANEERNTCDNGHEWCDECYGERFVTCEYSSDIIDRDDARTVIFTRKTPDHTNLYSADDLYTFNRRAWREFTEEWHYYHADDQAYYHEDNSEYFCTDSDDCALIIITKHLGRERTFISQTERWHAANKVSDGSHVCLRHDTDEFTEWYRLLFGDDAEDMRCNNVDLIDAYFRHDVPRESAYLIVPSQQEERDRIFNEIKSQIQEEV